MTGKFLHKHFIPFILYYVCNLETPRYDSVNIKHMLIISGRIDYNMSM